LLCPAGATVAPQPGTDDTDEPVELPLGLVVRWQSGKDRPLERLEPVPRLFGRPLDQAHPKLAGDNRVTWLGRVWAPYDGHYTFALRATGVSGAALKLAGKPARLEEPVALQFGNVPFELSASVEPGASLELLWQSDRFDRERMAPRFFRHADPEAAGPALEAQRAEDRGAVLAEAYGCLRCHAGPAQWCATLAEGLRPEIVLPGPRLRGVAQRVHGDWLARYLRDPVALRPGTRMPAIPSDTPADREALDTIAAYLSSGPGDQRAAMPPGSADRGRQLFQASACAACHEPAEPILAARGLPIPKLSGLAEKWHPGALVEFLRAPLVHRPHGRMPDFAFTGEECGDLALCLLKRDDAGRAAAESAGTATADGVPLTDRDWIPMRGSQAWLADEPVEFRGGQDHLVVAGTTRFRPRPVARRTVWLSWPRPTFRPDRRVDLAVGVEVHVARIVHEVTSSLGKFTGPASRRHWLQRSSPGPRRSDRQPPFSRRPDPLR
jgi:mono/diheme cytochrome c family protein